MSDEHDADSAAEHAPREQLLDELRAIQDGMQDGMLTADVETKRFVRCNRAMCQMLGYTQQELLACSVMDIHPADEVPRVLEAFQAQVAGKLRVAAEIPVLREDGSVFFADITQQLITVRGRTYTVGIFRDVSERRASQAALRESTQRYELAVRGADVGLWDYNVVTGHVYFSPRWKSLFGYAEDEIGCSVDDWVRLLHPDERERILKLQADFLAGRELTLRAEYRLRHKDGSWRWISAHGLVVRDDQGRAVRFVGSHGDITDRKRAEEALQQSHDELRAIYDSLGEGLLVADQQSFRFLRANAAICSMLGYTAEELLSRTILDLHPPEALERLLTVLRDLRVGNLPAACNLPVLRKDGSVFYADIGGTIFVYQGRPCLMGVFRDVTERRQAQEALERERRTLEHLLRASDHERQLIAYDIHDGLAQDLAGAIMHLQIHEQFRSTWDDAAQTTFDIGIRLLRKAHAEARRLISGVRPPILDESGVVAAVAHLIHDPAAAAGPQVDFRSRVHFRRLSPLVENVIYRIVQEALSNARAHSRSPRVVVSLMQRGDRVRIQVRDWGVGFDPQVAGANRFGLDGIRQRARILGGTCRIRSRPGAGTVIAVDLPVAEETPK